MADRPIAVFFELEGWEEPVLRERLPDVDIRGTRDRLEPGNVEPARDADVVAVFINSRLPAELIAELPAPRMVAARSTGFDHIDLEACRARGITVSNVPTYGENTEVPPYTSS
mgnify:CR=1 FL=1